MRWIWTMLAVLACAGTTTGTPTDEDTGITTPAPTEDEVNAAIEDANHCTAASECVDLGAQCPFGCWILVNASEADAVQAQIDAYFASIDWTCTYSCSNRGELECNAGVCEAEPEY